MADTANKPNSRQRLADRYRASHPEMNMDDESTDLAGLAADELDEFDKDRAASAEMNEKMNTLFNSDERASRIFIGWANGQDPIENLIELYGEDLVDALNSPEGKEKFKAALEKWRKGKQADEEHTKQYDANIAKSASNLIAFADKYGLSDEQVSALVEKAWQIGTEISNGLYTPEILELVHKGGSYDAAVNDAREEGRVNGRNETIKRELRKSKPVSSLPPTAGDQGAISGEGAPTKQKARRIDALGGIPIRK